MTNLNIFFFSKIGGQPIFYKIEKHSVHFKEHARILLHFRNPLFDLGIRELP